MTNKTNQAVAKVKALISDNDELFQEFFIDTATFSPNTTRKKEYLKQNLDRIIKKFIQKNHQIYAEYEDFLMDFGQWLENVTFPIQQFTPTITSTNPPPKQPPSTTVQYQTTHQPPQPAYRPPQTQQNYHRPVMHQRSGNTYWPPRPPTYENEEQKAKKILMKLSDAFDQPERRYYFFEEIKKELNQRT